MDGTLIKQRYLIQKLLGEGGMGEVFSAIDTQTREMVAVKILFGSVDDDPKLARSLMHEARAVARLNHPNIVQLIDYGQTGQGRPFLVMEFVPGKGLDGWLGYLSMKDVHDIFDQILAALAYAHARGVIHRDLKPENVMLVEDEDGVLHAKLVDFGIAQVEDLEAMAEGGNTERAVSKKIVGTPSYMAPEQARGRVREVGPETDLYALGIMLYLFVCGSVPFVRDTFMAVILAQVHDPVPELKPMIGARVPPGLEVLVMRLLEKEPGNRPMFAADVRRMLRRLDWDQASDLPPAALTTSELMSVTGLADFEEETGAYDLDGHSDLLKTLLVDTTDALQEEPSAMSLSAGLFAVRETPFVGRTYIRGTLWDELEATLEEASVRVTVLSGPVGVGKSRLARWLGERAMEEGLMQPIFCGVGQSSALPKGGLRTLIERYVRINGLERESSRTMLATRLVKTGIIEQSELDPLFDFLRPSSRTGMIAENSALEPVGAAARILRSATQKRPVLLWIDDLDGPDAALLVDLIDFLVASRAFSPMPIFPVITVPEGRMANPPAALKQLFELSQDEESVVWHRLEPMSHEELIELAHATLPLTDEAAERAAYECRGRPQLISQLLAHWVEQKVLADDGSGRLRPTDPGRSSVSNLQSLFKTRLGQILVQTTLPTETLAVVKIAAVCGRQFDIAVIETVLRQESPALIAKLGEVWNFVVAQELWIDIDERTAAFATPELHEQGLATLNNRAEEVRLNALVAQAKETVYSEAIASYHGEIAEHCEAAGLYDNANRHLVAAAHQAQVWGRYGEAIRWLNRVHGILDMHTVTNAPARADEADLGLAMSHLRVGNYEEADLYLDAIDGRARPGRRDHTHARLVLLRAELARKRGKLDAAIEKYEEAERLFQRIPDGRGVATAMQGLADVLILRVRYPEAQKAVQTAYQLHLANDAPMEAGKCLVIQGNLAALQHDFDRAESLFKRASNNFAEVGARHAAADAGFSMVHVLAQTGKMREAVGQLGQLLKQYIDVGDQGAIARVHRALGQFNVRLGNLDAAESSARAALDIAQRIGDQLTIARAYNGLGEVARKREDWEGARENYTRYLEAAQGLGDTLSILIGTANLGLINAQLGVWEDAAENFESAVSMTRQAGNKPFLGAFLGCLANAWAQVGRHDRANEAFDEAMDIDAELNISEADFLNALENFAACVSSRDPARARRALEVAWERWLQVGREDGVDRVKAAIAALPD